MVRVVEESVLDRELGIPLLQPAPLRITAAVMKHLILITAGTLAFAGCSTQSTKSAPPKTSPAPAASAPASSVGTKDAEGYTLLFDGTWNGWRVSLGLIQAAILESRIPR